MMHVLADKILQKTKGKQSEQTVASPPGVRVSPRQIEIFENKTKNTLELRRTNTARQTSRAGAISRNENIYSNRVVTADKIKRPATQME